DWLSEEERLATGQSIKWIDENKYQLDFLKGGYRLPETTEWECYARGGTTGSFDFGEPDAEYAKSFQQNISVGPRFFDPSWKVGAEWTHPAHKSTKSVRDIVFDSSFHAIWLKSFKTPGFNGGLSRPKEKLEHCFRVLLPLNNEVK
nr:hypothetical protein [Pirellula sp.]